jgi:hypothetical protein
VLGAPSAHYITDKEWNYSMLYMYTNMEEVIFYIIKVTNSNFAGCEALS